MYFPLKTVTCYKDPMKLLFGNHCEPKAWKSFNCSNDVLHIVPRAHIAALAHDT